MSLLALAITGLVTIFAPLQAMVLAPLPFPSADQLVVVDAPVIDFYTDSFPYRDALSPVLAHVAGYRTDVSLVGLSAGSPTTLRATVTSVTREFFATLDIPPMLGRDFATTDFAQYAQDQAPVDAAVAIVSDEFWRTKLSEVRDVTNASVIVGAARYRVIGVAPRMAFPASTEIWVPTRAPFAPRGDAQHKSWYSSAMDAIRAAPGVTDVAWLFPTPFMPGGDHLRTIVPIDPLDGSYRSNQFGFVRIASPQTFRALGMHLRAGRTIEPEELVPPRILRHQAPAGKPDVAVVNETLAKRIWPNEDPIGKELLVGYPVVVVGVVADIHESLDRHDVPPTVYVPAFPEGAAWTFVIKVSSDVPVATVASTLPDALTTRVPELPRPTVALLADQIAEPLRSVRFALYLLASFAIVGTLVAGVGVYAMSAEASASRIHEMGVRLALGATPDQIRWLAMRRGLTLVVLTIPVGAFAAWAAARAFSHSLVHVAQIDAVSLSICSALLIGVAFVASLPSAFRAATVDASAVLRSDTRSPRRFCSGTEPRSTGGSALKLSRPRSGKTN